MLSLFIALLLNSNAQAAAPFSITTKACFSLWYSQRPEPINRAAAKAVCANYEGTHLEKVGEKSEIFLPEDPYRGCLEYRQEYICKGEE